MSRPTGAGSVGRGLPEFDRLLVEVTEHIEREALAQARRTLITLLRLRPKDPMVLEIQAFLETQSEASAETAPLHRLPGHETWVNSVAFTADGKTAYTASGGEFGEHGFTDGPDCTIRAWNVDKGTALKTLPGHSSLINSIAVVPPKGHILSGTRGGSIALWDPGTDRAVRTYQRNEGQAVLCLARSSDGSRFLSGSEDRLVRLWDVNSAQRLRKCAGHTQPVTSVAFFPDGRQALSGSQDQTVRLWSLDSGQEMRKFGGHTMAVMTVAVSADGRRFLSAGGDPGIRLWEATTGTEVRRFEGHSNVINSVAFTPNGRFVVSASADKTIRLWDVETGHELCCFAGHGDTVRNIAVSPDGRFLMSGSNDKTACLWSLPV
jgi:WD40 repeat protein